MKPLLIGQAPGPNTRPEPRYDLFPYPKTSAGARLLKFSGLSRLQYMQLFDRVNLIPEFPGPHRTQRGDAFPPRVAEQNAKEMAPTLRGRAVVCVGRKVGDAFGLKSLPLFTWTWNSTHEFCIAVVAHTSGLSFAYNDVVAQSELAGVMREAITWSEVLTTDHLPRGFAGAMPGHGLT